jgi:hypothetical protein
MLLTIRELDKLSMVIDRIHDRWFDVDEVTYDSGARTVRIPFWSRPTQRAPMPPGPGQPEPFDDLLVVHDVDRLRIEDREQIGTYTFNDIVVRGIDLLIRADPHLRINCEVGSLHITVGADQGE